MGQITYGLLYGIPDQKIQGFEPDKTLEEYRASQIGRIKKLEKALGYLWRAEAAVVPSCQTESDTPFMGFVFAAGASGKDGVPFLGSFRVDAPLDNDERYKKSLKAAARAWAAFSAWCDGQGIRMPEAHVWLIETEVA